MLPETFRARLQRARMLTPRVKELVFTRVDGQAFSFTPGQWVSLVLPIDDEKGRPLRRSYSIASAAPGLELELIITKVDGGRGSTFLHDAPPGLELDLKGPQGAFTRSLDRTEPSLFVATGTGIAPMRSMLHHALSNGHTEPLWVLFGVRTLADALYLDELSALSLRHPNFKVELTLSRPPDGYRGRTGYVQAHVLELWNELARVAPPHAYICGVKKMLVTVRDALKTQANVERQRLHLESYD